MDGGWERGRSGRRGGRHKVGAGDGAVNAALVYTVSQYAAFQSISWIVWIVQ